MTEYYDDVMVNDGLTVADDGLSIEDMRAAVEAMLTELGKAGRKAYYQENRERILAGRDREKNRQYAKKYYKKNREQVLERQQKHYEDNRYEILAKLKAKREETKNDTGNQEGRDLPGHSW